MAETKRTEKRIRHADDFAPWGIEADDSCAGCWWMDALWQTQLSPATPTNPRGFTVGEQTFVATMLFSAMVPIHDEKLSRS